MTQTDEENSPNFGQTLVCPLHFLALCFARTTEPAQMKHFKIVVEKHPDGYVAYPLGLKGVVVGEGDTYDEALADVKSAIHFHIKTFGKDVLNVDSPVLEAFVAEAGVPV
jgi:predicted RNase H-like HicB family nuclease